MATAKKTAKKAKKLSGKAWATKMAAAKRAKARERGELATTAGPAAPAKKARAKKGTAKKARAKKGTAKKARAKGEGKGTVAARLNTLEKRVYGLEVSEAQHHRILSGMVNAWRRSKGLKVYKDGKLPGLRTPRLYSSGAVRGVKVSKLFGSGG